MPSLCTAESHRPAAFLAENAVRTVFRNAYVFNPVGSVHAHLAENGSRMFEKEIVRLKGSKIM